MNYVSTPLGGNVHLVALWVASLAVSGCALGIVSSPDDAPRAANKEGSALWQQRAVLWRDHPRHQPEKSVGLTASADVFAAEQQVAEGDLDQITVFTEPKPDVVPVQPPNLATIQKTAKLVVHRQHLATEPAQPHDTLQADKSQTGSASSLFSSVAAIVSRPLKVVMDGSKFLAAKAKIASAAFVKAAGTSAQEVERGNLTGVLQATQRAFEEVEEQSQLQDRSMSSSSGQSTGITIVLLAIVVCWSLELLLTKTLSEKRQEMQEAEKADPESKPFLHAISFMRFIMAWHVVLDNFWLVGDGEQTSMMGEPWAVFARWGCLAAPWFYLVSGFTNTYSKLVSSRRDESEDFVHAMIKRVLSWYPLFVLSLVVCCIHRWSGRAEDWSEFMANLLLFGPLIWENTTWPYQIVTQWFSYFCCYLLAFSPMYSTMNDGKNTVLWTLFTVAIMVAFPSAILEWIWFGDFPLYNMLQLWPSFVFGQGSAFWFVRNCMNEKEITSTGEKVWELRPVQDIPVIVRFGATFSIAVLGIIYFTFSPYDPVPLFRQAVKPLVQKGLQLPLQALMVTGLACEIDPMAKLFARKPFRWAEKLPLMMYISQAPVHYVVKAWTGRDGFTWTFSISLLAVSAFIHFCVERPYRNLMGYREK